MRRRSTSQGISSDKGLDSPSHNSKRREINNLDRAETSGGRGSSEGGRAHGRHRNRDDRDHHGGPIAHSERNRQSMRHGDTGDRLAPRPVDRDDKNIQSAKTFRRGRIIIFLRQLQVKRDTLVNQLQQPEFKSIEQVISGELKAVDEMIQQFTHLFELREIESDDPTNP
ncbi:hypothetical protein ACP8HI_24505 [Paenibacillus sp. FA6]|uniref:hypothetical protein n=1 Tax=Paenibacillus sp. FA6 TaxID=3413029 RepID=UPI003F65E725